MKRAAVHTRARGKLRDLWAKGVPLLSTPSI
jgi:hypothetical protein